MADQLQLRGGDTASNNSFTGAQRELSVDTQTNTLILHDGVTPGGHPLVSTQGADFTGDVNITGDLTLGTDKITLNAGNGSASFAETIYGKNVQFSTTVENAFQLRALYNNNCNFTVTNRAAYFGGDQAFSGAGSNAQINADGSAEFAGTLIAGKISGDNSTDYFRWRDSDGITIYDPTAASNTEVFKSFTNVGGSLKQQITFKSNGSAEFASTVSAQGSVLTSDQRFKTNVVPAKPQLEDVVKLGKMLCTWDWTEDAPVSDKDTRFLGLIAQDLETVCPSLIKPVTRTKTMEIEPPVLGPEGKVIKEAVTEEVDDSYKAIKNDVFIMKLLGAVAELTARVEELENK